MGSTHSNRGKKKLSIKDYISWFEIPVVNFDQAINFYNHIYEIDMEQVTLNGYRMAFFPSSNGIGGALVSGPGSLPSETGVLVYLNAGKDLNNVLSRIEPAGGRIVMPKTLISEEEGYFAIFIDSEGNKLALHSQE
jgi:predicted enzyme related to lactoylglutathione lyase